LGAAEAVGVMAVEEARIRWHGRMARASCSHLRPHDSELQSLHKVNALCVLCVMFSDGHECWLTRECESGSSARAHTLLHAQSCRGAVTCWR
jgi:hypothetical protein